MILPGRTPEDVQALNNAEAAGGKSPFPFNPDELQGKAAEPDSHHANVEERRGDGSVFLKVNQPLDDGPPPAEKFMKFVEAAANRSLDPQAWGNWCQAELTKFGGIGEGLNEAKEETKAAVVAGVKALFDGTVTNFLAQPNAINEPLFKTVPNVVDAMGMDPNSVNHALEALGNAVVKASNDYSAKGPAEQGEDIGKAMFGMANLEGSTEGAEVALKVLDRVATHVDKTVWSAIDTTMVAIKDMAPDLAAQTKQSLYDYIRASGITGPELEAAGVPRDYFAAMSDAAGGKEENFLAMSKAEGSDGAPKKAKLSDSAGEIEFQIDKSTGRLQRTDMGKVRPPYNWEAINERFSSEVVRQTTDDSCISAVGEMLSQGRLSEKELITKLGERPDIFDLLEHLGPNWSKKGKFRSLAEIGKNGPWGTELMENAGTDLGKSVHSVIVEVITSSGNVVIHDPWEGTVYEMTEKNFNKGWTRRIVYKTEL